MRHVTFPIAGQKYGFLYNAQAMFELEETYGEIEKIMEIAQSKKEPRKVLHICEVLSIQSECALHAMGQKPYKTFMVKDIFPLLSPRDFFKLKTIIAAAINSGLTQEIEHEGEIDLGLLEIQKKTENQNISDVT